LLLIHSQAREVGDESKPSETLHLQLVGLREVARKLESVVGSGGANVTMAALEKSVTDAFVSDWSADEQSSQLASAGTCVEMLDSVLSDVRGVLRSASGLQRLLDTVQAEVLDGDVEEAEKSDAASVRNDVTEAVELLEHQVLSDISDVWHKVHGLTSEDSADSQVDTGVQSGDGISVALRGTMDTFAARVKKALSLEPELTSLKAVVRKRVMEVHAKDRKLETEISKLTVCQARLEEAQVRAQEAEELRKKVSTLQSRVDGHRDEYESAMAVVQNDIAVYESQIQDLKQQLVAQETVAANANASSDAHGGGKSNGSIESRAGPNVGDLVDAVVEGDVQGMLVAVRHSRRQAQRMRGEWLQRSIAQLRPLDHTQSIKHTRQVADKMQPARGFSVCSQELKLRSLAQQVAELESNACVVDVSKTKTRRGVGPDGLTPRVMSLRQQYLGQRAKVLALQQEVQSVRSTTSSRGAGKAVDLMSAGLGRGGGSKARAVRVGAVSVGCSSGRDGQAPSGLASWMRRLDGVGIDVSNEFVAKLGRTMIDAI
jgi:hypothetical protein